MYKVITPVSTEPLTPTEAKLHLRVADTAEDSLIISLMTAAREFCENITGRPFATQTFELILSEFPACGYIELPLPPLQSVESVKYKDYAGTEATLDTSEYIVDTDSTLGRIQLAYGESWPSFTPYPSNPIRVRFTAGYVVLPNPLKQAMLLLIGHWYANRETILVGATSKEIEFSVKALISQYKVRWFE